MSDPPAFSAQEPRYDQSHFYGRLKGIVALFNPMKLFKSDEDIKEAKQLMEDFKNGKLPPDTHRIKLWDARETIEARCHPDTGEQIPRLLCFAAYGPMQPPIVIGMTLPNTAMATQLFWQWYNQSFNVAVNYANRNQAGTLTDAQLGVAYGVAVGSSMGTAYGMNKASKSLTKKYPSAGAALQITIPFCAVVAAGTLSLLIVRQAEWKNGIEVFDGEGQCHGNSKVAAYTGLTQCAIARVVWNIPVLLVPPIMFSALDKTSIFKGRAKTRLGAMVVASTGCVFLGLYPAQALFPQRASLPVAKLEHRFQGLVSQRSGLPVSRLFFNKGL